MLSKATLQVWQESHYTVQTGEAFSWISPITILLSPDFRLGFPKEEDVLFYGKSGLLVPLNPISFFHFFACTFKSNLLFSLLLVLWSKSESDVAQSCPTLCDPKACNLPGFSVHGIFQANVLEWVAISFSRGSSWSRDRTQVSCIAGRRFTLWATREAPFSPMLLLLSHFSCVQLCATP